MNESSSHLPPDVEDLTRPTLFEETIVVVSLVLAVLFLLLFTWIADSMEHNRTQSFDLSVRTAVHQYASPGLTKAMFAITFLGGDGLVVAAFVSFGLFLYFHRRRAALWLVVTFAGAIILDLALKYGFHRTRPTPFFGRSRARIASPAGIRYFRFAFMECSRDCWLSESARVPHASRSGLLRPS